MKKPVKYISASQINLFLFCPLAYKKSYLEGARPKDPPNIYMIYGSAIHEALAFNFEQKIKSRKDYSLMEVMTKFKQVFEREYKKINFQNDTIIQSMLLSAENSLGYYLENIAPDIQPLYVEHKFEIKLKNFPITIMGYIDLIDTDYTVIDYKTVGKNWKSQYSLSKLASNVQMTIYAAAVRKLFKPKENRLRFDVMPRNEAQVYLKETSRTEEDIIKILQIATNIEKIIELGILVPCYASCGSCQYKQTCNKRPFIEEKNLTKLKK